MPKGQPMDWDAIRDGLGWQDEGNMHRYYYEVEKMTLKEMSALYSQYFGAALDTVRKRLWFFDIKMRQGGNQGGESTGKGTPKARRKAKPAPAVNETDRELMRWPRCAKVNNHRNNLMEFVGV